MGRRPFDINGGVKQIGVVRRGFRCPGVFFCRPSWFSEFLLAVSVVQCRLVVAAGVNL